MTSPIDIVEKLWEQWASAGNLMADRWDWGTRLGSWTVRDLYSHVSRGVGHVERFTDRRSEGRVTLDGPGAYFAFYGPRQEEASARVDRLARRDAEACTTHELVERFYIGGPRTAATARAMGDRAVVETDIGTIRMGDYVSTRIVEATVHLLDLRAALGSGERPSRAALAATSRVLVSMCDPIDLVAAATGRPCNPVFPVLV